MPLRLALSPRDAVVERLDGVAERTVELEGHSIRLTTALPKGHATSRRRFPVVVLLSPGFLGTATEMSRLLAGSREVEPCVVVQAEGVPRDPETLRALAEHCRRAFRGDAREIAVFVHQDPELVRVCCAGIAGVSRFIFGTLDVESDLPPPPAAGSRRSRFAWTVPVVQVTEKDDPRVSWKALPEASGDSLAASAFVHGLRTFWPRDHRYGDEAIPLARPLVARGLKVLAPLFRAIAPRKTAQPAPVGGFVVRSDGMARDFEVFVSVPAGRPKGSTKYAALVALDANAGFATVSETVARLAVAGEIEPTIVIGVGTPRAQGDIEFGYRRFEELAPPLRDGYQLEDELGRFFTAFYGLRGQDAQAQMGLAPGLWHFIVHELLPELIREYPIDPAKLTLLGHSAAGTFVAFGIAQPDSPFSGYLCLSPGVAIAGHWMLTGAALDPPTPATGADAKPPRVYCSLGSEELDNRFNIIAGIPQTKLYAEALQRRRGADVQYAVLDGETHTSVYPRAVAAGLIALRTKAANRNPLRKRA